MVGRVATEARPDRIRSSCLAGPVVAVVVAQSVGQAAPAARGHLPVGPAVAAEAHGTAAPERVEPAHLD